VTHKARESAQYLLENRDILWDAIVEATKNEERKINAADVQAVLVEIVEGN